MFTFINIYEQTETKLILIYVASLHIFIIQLSLDKTHM